MIKKSYFKILAIVILLFAFNIQTTAAKDVLPSSKLPISVESLQDEIIAPWDYEAITPLYQINLDPSKLAKGKTYSVEIPYSGKNNNYKKVFYFDKGKGIWRPLPTKDDPQNNKVRVELPFTFVRLAVFASQDILTVGKASWYAHKGGMFTASPDFAKGSVLRVYNLDNGKFVDVTVNDYGPERKLHPDRVVDLDKVAFNKIASTKSGVINVKIEVLKAVGQNLNQDLAPATEPKVSAWSAVILDESSGEVLWGKNETKVTPLASLTKIVTAYVFLSTNPTLSNQITYSVQDENYNYKYCKPHESSRLKVKDGETMTLENALYAMLVGSANNSAETLVRNSDLTREQFIARMNETVAAWGATSTLFIEPSGLSPDNVSSPLDYAIITKEAFKNPLLKKISTTYKYSFSTINTKEKHNLTNTNQLISANKYNIIGSKTGYLHESLYCLMTKVQVNGKNLIVVNFGSSNKNNNFIDNETLIKYGERLLKNGI